MNCEGVDNRETTLVPCYSQILSGSNNYYAELLGYNVDDKYEVDEVFASLFSYWMAEKF